MFSSASSITLSSPGAPPPQQQQQPQQQYQPPQEQYQPPQEQYQQPQQQYQQPQYQQQPQYEQPQQYQQPQQQYQQPKPQYHNQPQYQSEPMLMGQSYLPQQQQQNVPKNQQPLRYRPRRQYTAPSARDDYNPDERPVPVPGRVFTQKPPRVRAKIAGSPEPVPAPATIRSGGHTTTPAMREQTQFLPLFDKGASYLLQNPPAIDLNSLPVQVVQMYKRRFDAIDLNKDGIITLREIATVGKVFGYKLSREELGEIFNKRDIDDSGTITFDEFVKALWERANRNKSQGPIRQIFQQFDVHNRGYITSDEAYPILRDELGFDMNKTETIIDMFDKNKDYRLSLTEFIEFYQKVQELKTEIVKAFNEWDSSRDGYVDFEEARNIMGPKGFSDEDIRAMISKYDEDQDGRLSYPEFAKFWDIPLFES